MLRNSQNQILQLTRFVSNCARSFANAKDTKIKQKITDYKTAHEDVPTEESINAYYLSRTFGSSYRIWNFALQKHPELKTLKRKDLAQSVDTLKALNYEIDEIVTKPMIIYYNYFTLMNRHLVLTECGFTSISIAMLAKYITIMNKSVQTLKSHQYINYDVNVSESLKSCFKDVDVELINSVDRQQHETNTMKMLRQVVLAQYLRQRLEMNENDLNKMWKSYSRVRHKSFKSIEENINMLINELNFPKERIKKNIFLLHCDADNVRRIIKHIKTIDSIDIREILYKRPKIMMSSCEGLQKTLEHIRAFGIRENALLRCLELLTLGPDTVLERLRDINEIEEFQVLGTNPRILRLVHYQNKARLRLDYLNQLKVRCASLHILSCNSDAFVKFARDGSDRTKGRDIVIYLSNELKKDENDLRNLLSRHPNWCHIPLLNIKQCLKYLESKKFSVDDIFNNVHLLLYPTQCIEAKLQLLQNAEFMENLQLSVKSMHDMDNNELLTLILYLIELEFHFTGDGVWTEQNTHHVENFNNLLPDFPESLNKVYKYGVKPVEKFLIQHS